MRGQGLKMWRQVVHRLGSRFERKVLILLYHRIAELNSDPWALSVTPDHFAEHLEVLRHYAPPIPLRQLAGALQSGVLPRRAVVITFDDGYVDNLLNAKPLLERYDVPATVFLTTGKLQSEGEFWWDELDRLFLQPNPLPETLHLKVNGTTYRWELGETAHYGEADFLRQRRWTAWEEAPTARHALYRSLWEVLQPLPEQERLTALDHLHTWADAAPIQRETHRLLSISEALTLAHGGLIEIGAHTVTHPALSSLPVDCQWPEIQQSRAYLEDLLGTEITSFSYPYGRPSDYTGETVRLVREAGFTCACAGSGGIVRPSTERFELPRVHVSDGDGEQFDQWLRRQFNG